MAHFLKKTFYLIKIVYFLSLSLSLSLCQSYCTIYLTQESYEPWSDRFLFSAVDVIKLFCRKSRFPNKKFGLMSETAQKCENSECGYFKYYYTEYCF